MSSQLPVEANTKMLICMFSKRVWLPFGQFLLFAVLMASLATCLLLELHAYRASVVFKSSNLSRKQIRVIFKILNY